MLVAETMKEDLALVRTKRMKNYLYGLRQNLKSPSRQIYMNIKYFEKLKDLKSDKKIYLLPKSFFEKFAIEQKRSHVINVIGEKID